MTRMHPAVLHRQPEDGVVLILEALDRVAAPYGSWEFVAIIHHEVRPFERPRCRLVGYPHAFCGYISRRLACAVSFARASSNEEARSSLCPNGL